MFRKPQKTTEPENKEKAYDYAVFLLSLQLRTVGEVREKMLGRGYSAAVIDDVISQLVDLKYLNDERYAQVFLDNLKQYKNFGYYGIKKKMLEKKLPVELITRILDEDLSAEEEMKIAKRFIGRQVPRGVIAGSAQGEAILSSDKGLPRPSLRWGLAMAQKQKLAAKLKSRGFRGSVIAALLF